MVCHVCGTLVNLVNRGRYLKSTWKVPEKYLESCNTKIRTKNEWKVMGNIWAGLYNTKNHLTTVADVAIATKTSANIISFFTTLNIITPASPGWALFCLALASCLYCPPIGRQAAASLLLCLLNEQYHDPNYNTIWHKYMLWIVLDGLFCLHDSLVYCFRDPSWVVNTFRIVDLVKR